jgi:hypothetical protein
LRWPLHGSSRARGRRSGPVRLRGAHNHLDSGARRARGEGAGRGLSTHEHEITEPVDLARPDATTTATWMAIDGNELDTDGRGA